MDVIGRAGTWTLADLRDLPDDGHRYEVVDGNLVVSPPASGWHQTVGSALLVQLAAACPSQWKVVYESYLDYGGDGRVPDLLVVRAAAARPRSELGFAPSEVGLVVEIVSPSSRRTDRLAKPAEYAELGIPLMWRVELEPTVRVHGFRLGTDRYVEVPGDAPVPWGALSLDLSGLLPD